MSDLDELARAVQRHEAGRRRFTRPTKGWGGSLIMLVVLLGAVALVLVVGKSSDADADNMIGLLTFISLVMALVWAISFGVRSGLAKYERDRLR